MSGRYARWLVRLYPRAWRERYEHEFVALLDQRPLALWDLLDAMFGALDARLRPRVVSERRLVALSGLRGSVLAGLWAWIGLVVAGVGFRKMTEYEDFVRAARDSALVGAAFDAVVIGAVVALAAVMTGGAPIIFAALRKALVEGHKDVPLLLCVPLLSSTGFVGYVLVLTRLVYPALGRLAVHDSMNVALFLSMVTAFLFAAVSGAAAVSIAVRRSEVGERLFRFALGPAVAAFAAMVLVLVGTVVWGLALAAQAPALFAENDGILATGTAVTWLVIVTVMSVSILMAGFAVVCGLRALRTAGAATS